MRVQWRDNAGAICGGIEVLQFRIHGDEFLADDFTRRMFCPRAVEKNDSFADLIYMKAGYHMCIERKKRERILHTLGKKITDRLEKGFRQLRHVHSMRRRFEAYVGHAAFDVGEVLIAHVGFGSKDVLVHEQLLGCVVYEPV